MEDGIESSSCHTSIMVDEEDDYASVDDGEDIDIVLEASKNPKTAKLPRCIFKVPEVLRRHNLKAYVPDVVSIGPIHHPKDHKQFQLMEDMKQRYLLELLSRMDVVNLKTLVKDVIEFSDQESEGILGYEERARLFYAEPIDDDYNHYNEFIEMIIRDGCFIVQLFRKHKNKKLRDTNDPIFTMDCMFQYICHDLLLLENQLPWFVLKSIYSFTEENYPNGGFSLLELILTVLSTQRQLRDNCRSYLDDYKGKEEKTILHILDLIRTSIVFSLEPYPFENKKPYHDSNIQSINSATVLSEAGIKLKMTGKKNCDHIRGKHKKLKMFPQACKSIMNIKFEKGVLTIPHLAIGEMTESLFRNLIALEQCCHGRSHKITSYAVLMDNLIGSKKDMEFLSEKKIIGNWLSAEDGYQFFNKLHNDTVLSKFYYGGLCAEVKTYQVNWRRYREVFKRNYCSDPWKATSWFAACVLLFLTVVQTAYTLKQYYSPA